MATINRADFKGIGDIANHCDLGKLNTAINEASIIEMEGVFNGFWQIILNNLESQETHWLDLINGNDKHKGIRTIWAYYAYSRYIILNGFNDTPNGMVNKTNGFSMPKPLKELQAFADKYKNIAKVLTVKTEAYICENKHLFTDLNGYICKCEDISNINTKGFGFKSNIITKQ